MFYNSRKMPSTLYDSIEYCNNITYSKANVTYLYSFFIFFASKLLKIEAISSSVEL